MASVYNFFRDRAMKVFRGLSPWTNTTCHNSPSARIHYWRRSPVTNVLPVQPPSRLNNFIDIFVLFSCHLIDSDLK